MKNTIMEHNKNYRTTKKVGSKLSKLLFQRSEETGIMEQQGTVKNRTLVLINFRSIIFGRSHNGNDNGFIMVEKCS